jgi:hypothetical protein
VDLNVGDDDEQESGEQKGRCVTIRLGAFGEMLVRHPEHSNDGCSLAVQWCCLWRCLE